MFFGILVGWCVCVSMSLWDCMTRLILFEWGCLCKFVCVCESVCLCVGMSVNCIALCVCVGLSVSVCVSVSVYQSGNVGLNFGLRLYCVWLSLDVSDP